MIQLDTQTLLRAVDFLTDKLDEVMLAGPEAKTESLEKLAKSISVHIKTLRDVATHNDEAQARADNQRYISYEDYPPLRPADRTKIITDLETLFDRITVDQSEDTGPDRL